MLVYIGSSNRFIEDYNAKHAQDEEEEQYEYDEDGNIIWTWKKVIEPLPPIDHSTISYKQFNKSVYKEHEDISSLPPKKVAFVIGLKNELFLWVVHRCLNCVSLWTFVFSVIMCQNQSPASPISPSINT